MSPTRRNTALGLLAAAAGAATAGRAFAQAPAPVEVAAAEIELPDEEGPPTTLNTSQDRNEHMLAPVTINGQGPFNFLLDTGANISCVSNRLMQKLDLKAGESAPVHTVVGVKQRPMVLLDRLQVGPRDRRKVKAPALPIQD